MKVRKWIDISREVEIELTIEDIVLIWAESTNKKYGVGSNITTIYHYLFALPDEAIEQFSPVARRIIYERLNEQVERFKSK